VLECVVKKGKRVLCLGSLGWGRLDLRRGADDRLADDVEEAGLRRGGVVANARDEEGSIVHRAFPSFAFESDGGSWNRLRLTLNPKLLKLDMVWYGMVSVFC
jgi:hypothetical protein